VPAIEPQTSASQIVMTAPLEVPPPPVVAQVPVAVQASSWMTTT
jgi:hypothetical protein